MLIASAEKLVSPTFHSLPGKSVPLETSLSKRLTHEGGSAILNGSNDSQGDRIATVVDTASA